MLLIEWINLLIVGVFTDIIYVIQMQYGQNIFLLEMTKLYEWISN